MSSCTVLQSETGNMRPLIIAAANSAEARGFASQKGIPDPLAILIRSWSELEGALVRTLELTSNWSSEPIHTASRTSELDAYKAFVYRCAEFAETIEKQSIALTGKYKIPRQLDRLLSEQCNALKHDNFYLNWVSACDHNHRVNGFRFRHRSGAKEVAEKRFHLKRPCYSFNMELRRYWACIYLLGDHAGRAVTATHGPPAGIYEPLSEAYIRMLELPDFVFWSESDAPFPLLRERLGAMEISLDGSPKTPVRGLTTTIVEWDDNFGMNDEFPRT